MFKCEFKASDGYVLCVLECDGDSTFIYISTWN